MRQKFRPSPYKLPSGFSANPTIEARSAEFDGTDGTDGRVGRTGWTDGTDGNQMGPLIFFILRYIKH